MANMMKTSKITLVIFFSFAVNGYAQQFNSVVQAGEFKAIGIKKEIKKDAVRTIKIIKDTIVLLQTIPEQHLLTLSQLPLDHIVLTSKFGYRVHPVIGGVKFHNGIDLSAHNANVYSVLHGTVVTSSYDDEIGNYIVINHGLYETTYGHLSLRYVQVGDLVKAGSIVGISGRTGRVTGEHLHFIVKYQGQSINPLPFLKIILTIHRKEELTNLLTKNK